MFIKAQYCSYFFWSKLVKHGIIFLWHSSCGFPSLASLKPPVHKLQPSAIFVLSSGVLLTCGWTLNAMPLNSVKQFSSLTHSALTCMSDGDDCCAVERMQTGWANTGWRTREDGIGWRVESFVEVVYDESRETMTGSWLGQSWKGEWVKMAAVWNGSRWRMSPLFLSHLPCSAPCPNSSLCPIQHHSLLSLSLQCLAPVVTLHPERMRSKAFFTLPSLGSVIQSSFFIFRSVMCRLFLYAVYRPDVTMRVDWA